MRTRQGQLHRMLTIKPHARKRLERNIERLEGRAVMAAFAFADFSDSSDLILLDNAIITSERALRIAPAVAKSRGAIWFDDPQFVSMGFETQFDFRLTGGGDSGFAFVIQNEGLDALGRQEPLGYGMIANSLALEFDTTFNANHGDPNDNHVAVHTGWTGFNHPHSEYELGVAIPSVDLNDGAVHTAKVSYVPGTLSIYVDAMADPLITVAVDLSESLDLDLGRAWVGFTASSGNQNHDILNWQFQSLLDANEAIGIVDVASVESNGGTTTLSFIVSRVGDHPF